MNCFRLKASILMSSRSVLHILSMEGRSQISLGTCVETADKWRTAPKCSLVFQPYLGRMMLFNGNDVLNDSLT